MSYNAKYFQIYLFFICLVTIISCKQDKRPDVSNINLDIKIQRFDQDLYGAKGKNLVETNKFLTQKYGYFYDDFTHRIIDNPNSSNTELIANLYKSLPYNDLNKEVDSVFPNLKKVENDLTETFKYIKYYYPKAKVPLFVSFLSGFAYQIPIGDNYMGIGLDMFLGKNSKFYGGIAASIPRYQSNRFEPQYIVPRVAEVYVREELVKENDADRSLLAKMVYNGKILYLMDQILPESTADTVKIGFTNKQLTWAKQFEGNIWGVFLENDLLYQTDYQKIQVYLSDGPFTPGIGERGFSAPKLGVFIGWQIVKKYMAANPEVTLQKLMAETDAQKILTKSKYKPKESM